MCIRTIFERAFKGSFCRHFDTHEKINPIPDEDLNRYNGLAGEREASLVNFAIDLAYARASRLMLGRLLALGCTSAL